MKWNYIEMLKAWYKKICLQQSIYLQKKLNHNIKLDMPGVGNESLVNL